MSKKLILLFSAVIVLCLFAVGCLAVFAESEEYALYQPTAQSLDPWTLKGDNTIGVHFSPTGSFQLISLHTPTWNDQGGGLKVTLYAWNGKYETSLTGAIASAAAENVVNEAWTQFDLGQVVPAGDYLLVVQNSGTAPEREIGLYTQALAFSGVSVYQQGRLRENYAPCMKVTLTETSDAPFGPITDPVKVDFYSGTADGNQLLLKNDLFAIQFAPAAPFYKLTVGAPSYSNDLGNLTFTLYRWDTNLTKTLQGEPVCPVKEFVNYPDVNEGLTMECFPDTHASLPAGEYVLSITNTSETSEEQVGLWTSRTAFPYARNYHNGTETAQWAQLIVTFDQPSAEKYRALSENLPEENPASGDSTDSFFYIAVLAVAAAAIFVFALRWRKEE